MFCDKCGFKLNNDSLFCPKCGTKINPVVNDSSDSESEIITTEDSYSEINEPEYAFSERIESVDDREENDALFRLYECFIDPLKKLEYTEQRLTACHEEHLKNSKGFRLSHFPLKAALGISFFYAIFGIIGAMRKWKPVKSIILKILWAPFYWIDHASITRPLIDHSLKLVDDSHLIRAILMLFFMYMIPGLLTILLICLIGGLIDFIIRKKHYPTSEKNLQMQINSRDEQIEALRPYIVVVPPKYRYSYAIQFFVSAYRNSQVKNLSEAINAYEQHIQMQGLRNEISSMSASVNNELRSIQYNQTDMMTQLKNIENSASKIKSGVDTANFQLLFK